MVRRVTAAPLARRRSPAHLTQAFQRAADGAAESDGTTMSFIIKHCDPAGRRKQIAVYFYSGLRLGCATWSSDLGKVVRYETLAAVEADIRRLTLRSQGSSTLLE